MVINTLGFLSLATSEIGAASDCDVFMIAISQNKIP